MRFVLTAAAGAIILAAVAIGALRLAMIQLPSYQAQIERSVGEALGLSLDFGRMDVRLSLHGPELTFHDVGVSVPGQLAPFLVARRAAVVLDAWSLLGEREVAPARLAFDGARLTLVRQRSGDLVLQRGPTGRETRADLALLLPEEIEVAVRDSLVTYVDRRRGLFWEFSSVTLDLQRTGEAVDLAARARPPAALGARLRASARSASIEDGDWRVAADVVGGDLAAVAPAFESVPALPDRGRGDASMRLRWSGGVLQRGTIEAELDGVAWTDGRGAGEPGYQRLAGELRWQRVGDAGWRLELDDVELARGGRSWPTASDAVLELERDADGLARLALASGFLRLQDLTPVVRALPDSTATLRWLERRPRGDLSDLDFELERADDGGFDYALSGGFEALAVEPAGRWPGFEGLSGELRADAGGGRVAFATGGAELDWPQLFRSRFAIERLSGLVVWREGFDAVRVVSDNLVLDTRDVDTHSSLELTLPLDGGSPQLDLAASLGAFDAVAAKRYLPVHAMPRRVVEWLDRAIVSGDVLGAELAFVGPLQAFPFDGGEGLFQATADVEDAVLEFADGWPRAERLDGRLEFTNAAFLAQGSGRVLGNVADELEVGIEDLREAIVNVRTRTSGPLSDVLAFVQGSPLIERHFGPGYERLSAPAGTGDVSLDLTLPLLDRSAYELSAALDIAAGELALDGLVPRATEIEGRVAFEDGELSGEALDAVFLGGPVTAGLSAAAVDGYRARLDVAGDVAAEAAADFGLVVDALADGRTQWRGSVLIPERADGGLAHRPLRLAVASDLAGLELKLPPPFAKPAEQSEELRVEVAVGTDGIDVSGRFGAMRRFALRLGGDEALRLERGTLRFGGGDAALRDEPGLTVQGALPVLRLDEWIALVRADGPWSGAGEALGESGVAELFNAAELDIDEFSVLGQQLGESRLDVRRDAGAWRIDVDSAVAAGTVIVPRDLGRRTAIDADMRRLHIAPVDGGEGHSDPRRLPGLRLIAEEFSFGERRFGRLEADVRAEAGGLRVVSFEAGGGAFEMTGSGAWLAGPEGAETQLAFDLAAADVAAALEQLGLQPVASGESASVTADIRWPGPPSADWTQHVGGELSLRLQTGSLLDIEPGAGRVVGLMSISALPRRLALDFRDVFNKGLVFDELAGDFRIVDGNAYTDNLKLTGPVADVGVAGRIGLRDRDYSQQVVVAAEPGNVLPTVGGLIGGPGVGAALLIFTRIFKEPLKGIGRVSYCVSGSWEDPAVERLSAEQLEAEELCADLPDGS